MLNKYGFVPKKQMQPDSYELMFNRWNAIYHHPSSGKAYMIEAVPKDNMEPLGEVNGFQVLTYNEEMSSRLILLECPSCKQATTYIERLFLENP